MLCILSYKKEHHGLGTPSLSLIKCFTQTSTDQSTPSTTASFPEVDFIEGRMISALPTNASSPAKQRGTSAHIHLTQQHVIPTETQSEPSSMLFESCQT